MALPPPVDLMERWLADLQADHSASTLRRYTSVLQRFFTWYATEARTPLTIKDLNPIVLVGYRNGIQTTEAPSTVNIHVSALRSWGKWLKQQGYLVDDSAARLKLVKRDRNASFVNTSDKQSLHPLTRRHYCFHCQQPTRTRA